MGESTAARLWARPVASSDYPADLAEFQAWFGSDEACLSYLEWLRWPDGFECPHCGSRDSGRESSGRIRCHPCRKQVSVTSGTIFDKTRVPMTVWFRAVWEFATPKTGVSAAHLRRMLPVNSYQTMWAMLSRLRSVVSTLDREPLSGRVEVDETLVGGPRSGRAGRGALGKTLLAGAIEVSASGWGRARLGVIPDASADSLRAFARANIAPGSTVVTDAWASYPSALEGYTHEPVNVSASGDPAHESLPAVHRLFALFKNMLAGAYMGGGSPDHLPGYADEFVFRFNRRHSRKRGMLFLRLLQRAVAAEPVTYRDLVRTPRPKQVHPTGVTGPRRTPGSLDIDPADRPWLPRR